MRCRSRSMSSTRTSTFWPMVSTSDGWLTWLQESSEMWMRPSMPSRSTNAPKSTMLEMVPVTRSPTFMRSRICSRAPRRSSSSTARRLRTTLLRKRLSSMTRHSRVWPRNSSRSATRRISTREAGRKPRTPRSRMRPPLTTSMTVPDDRSAFFGGLLDTLPGPLEPSALPGQDEPAVGVLLGQHEGVDDVAHRHFFSRIDRLSYGQLVGGDHAFALVADVDEDFVLVHPHHGPGDDVPLFESQDRGVVVGNHLPVDLDHEVLAAL